MLNTPQLAGPVVAIVGSSSAPNTQSPQQLVTDAEKEITGVQKLDPKAVKREGHLGGGAFSSVWRAVVNDEIVAVKDMSYRSEKEVDMWKREVQTLS